MPGLPDTLARTHRPTSRRMPPLRGFSFIEILFAVAVMGIGFIMIAAIFPIGLQQTKLTLDESTAASGSRGAVAGLQQMSQTLTQYTGGAIKDINNSTYAITHTLLAADLPNTTALTAGKSHVVYGTVRSLRDSRAFLDGSTTATAAARRDAMWQSAAGDIISKSDSRNANVVLFRHDILATNATGTVSGSPMGSAKVIVFNVQVATQSAFTAGDYYSSAAKPPDIYNLEPRPVGLAITHDDTNDVWLATLTGANAATYGLGAVGVTNATTYQAELNAVPGAAASGAFLVVADDQITAPTFDTGRMNGHIFRLGIERPDVGANVYQLAPGYEFVIDPGDSGAFNDTPAKDDIATLGVSGKGPKGTIGGRPFDGSNVESAGPALAYMIGKGFVNSSVTPASFGQYTGGVQDVACYTTFVTTP